MPIHSSFSFSQQMSQCTVMVLFDSIRFDSHYSAVRRSETKRKERDHHPPTQPTRCDRSNVCFVSFRFRFGFFSFVASSETPLSFEFEPNLAALPERRDESPRDETPRHSIRFDSLPSFIDWFPSSIHSIPFHYIILYYSISFKVLFVASLIFCSLPFVRYNSNNSNNSHIPVCFQTLPHLLPVSHFQTNRNTTQHNTTQHNTTQQPPTMYVILNDSMIQYYIPYVPFGFGILVSYSCSVVLCWYPTNCSWLVRFRSVRRFVWRNNTRYGTVR